jgi:hypothetical protein
VYTPPSFTPKEPEVGFSEYNHPEWSCRWWSERYHSWFFWCPKMDSWFYWSETQHKFFPMSWVDRVPPTGHEPTGFESLPRWTGPGEKGFVGKEGSGDRDGVHPNGDGRRDRDGKGPAGPEGFKFGGQPKDNGPPLGGRTPVGPDGKGFAGPDGSQFGKMPKADDGLPPGAPGNLTPVGPDGTAPGVAKGPDAVPPGIVR